MEALLTLEKVDKTYNMGKPNQVQALKQVDFTVYPADMIAIVGPSGSGKSTLLHILGCLDRPTSGRYFLDGQDVSSLRDSQLAGIRNRKIGFVLQDFGLISGRTVEENVSVPLLFSKVPYRKMGTKVRQTLESLHIADLINRRVEQLSGGQRQRVAIARAMVMEPAILLADEPTGALDTKTSEDMLEVLQALNAQGTTMVVVTHNPELAKGCKSRWSLVDGRLCQTA